MSFPRYPTYKDSGVEWMGQVPGHWSAGPIKHLGRLKGGAGFPHDKQGIEGEELSFHKVNALAQADSDGFLIQSDNTINRTTAKELGAFVFPPGSIVFAKVGAALLLGRIRVLDQDACLDNNMMGLVVYQTEFRVQFVRHAMNLVRFDLIANPGAVPSLNEGQIGDFRLPMPPKDEQTQIAAFLDRETAKIDGLVAEQRRLMALLKEKRQAVISHAVTQGLNPDAPMKPSDIEWLGDVPGHWEVKPLKHIGAIVSGYAFSSRDFTSSGVRVLKIANIQTFKIDWSDDSYLPNEFFEQHPKFVVKNDDVVFALTRPIISTGLKAAVVNIGGDQVLLNQRNALFRSFEGFSKNFVYQVLFSSSFLVAFENKIDFTGQQPNISPIDIGDIKVPVPPLAEQIAIAGYLESLASDFDILTTEAQRAIDLLQERRTALISAAVTGQIDVREFP